MLYIFDETDILDKGFLTSKMSLLSEDRQAKIRRLRSFAHSNASAIVYLLLRLALKENYDINEAVLFDYTEKGKPILKDYPHIHFNLSHSNSIAACVVNDTPVGVDVQQIKNVSDKVAGRVLTEKELLTFKSSLAPIEYFCKIWTIKESFLKRSGQGITTDLREISADDLKEIITFRGLNYFCSVCGQFLSEVVIKRVGREDFEKLCD